ncbi:IclR family transcriptional regulator [Rhizobium paknamense]|uniref:DNA-binding IclR family transcriptional regulator n=1 Tax=Rhizobium paknamense TaxID=1206817 RepID=A0ABU0IK40_9HYPH|nr:IclR family transcriptional regulator [Rhizobium paknamense]MDQ0457569.1 DNA-binding IclR family transcriptional regulator [Rhizobium paknamense]
MTEVVAEDAALARNGIQVISRAAAVLRALREDPNGLSLGQISERVGLARSTVQRIVAALQEERLVFSAGSGDIRLGPEITALAQAAKFNIVDLCRPLLIELSQKTGETADLSVLRGHQMIFLDQVPGSHRLRAVSAVGDIFPLTDTANGRAVLAAMPAETAERLVLEEFRQRGIKRTWSGFLPVLEHIRDQGIAYDLDEHTDGISAAGIAFCDWKGTLYAISVPLPTSRFEDQKRTVIQSLLDLKAETTRLFGS